MRLAPVGAGGSISRKPYQISCRGGTSHPRHTADSEACAVYSRRAFFRKRLARPSVRVLPVHFRVTGFAYLLIGCESVLDKRLVKPSDLYVLPGRLHLKCLTGTSQRNVFISSKRLTTSCFILLSHAETFAEVTSFTLLPERPANNARISGAAVVAGGPTRRERVGCSGLANTAASRSQHNRRRITNLSMGETGS